jgi:adenosine deaminase
MLLNLHCHLEGCVRPSTAQKIAKQTGIRQPIGGWENAFRIRENADLTAFLSHVAQAYPLLTSRANLHRVAFEAVEDAASNGQSYIELRLGPGTHARADLSVHDVLQAVCEGVSEAIASTRIQAGVIACMLRHEPQSLADEIARSAVSLAGSGIVGLDVAGDEILYPDLHRFASAYSLAREAGLGLTAHAAEAGPASAGREAIELLGVTRIGHGSHIADSPQLLEWVRQEGVSIEVCPTSNVLTGAAKSIAAHPIHAFVSAGVSVVLGDDNPENTGVRLREESRLLVTEGGLLENVVTNFARNSIAASFCADGERRDLLEILELELKSTK